MNALVSITLKYDTGMSECKIFKLYYISNTSNTYQTRHWRLNRIQQIKY